jgi:hypothetical protein
MTWSDTVALVDDATRFFRSDDGGATFGRRATASARRAPARQSRIVIGSPRQMGLFVGAWPDSTLTGNRVLVPSAALCADAAQQFRDRASSRSRG